MALTINVEGETQRAALLRAIQSRVAYLKAYTFDTSDVPFLQAIADQLTKHEKGDAQ